MCCKSWSRAQADPVLRRTLRMLKVPTTATVHYKGASGAGEMTLQKQGDNEYTGQFPELKENIRFYVRGEDYYTQELHILVVPTPTLIEMVVDEHRPAYMFYRVADGKLEALKGKKQLVSGIKISLYGGDTSRIDPVPAGTDLVLTATSDKKLVDIHIPPPRKGVAKVEAADVHLLDDTTFQVRFNAVRATPERPVYDFYFEMRDTDGVIGRRHMIIKPIDDAVPEVDLSAEIVRKTSQGYMVTPMALVPLRLKVVDDFGLVNLEYACTTARIDKGAEQGLRALLVLGALQWSAGGPGQELGALSRIAALSREAKSGGKADVEGDVKRFPIVPFQEKLAKQRQEYYTLKQIQERLGGRPPEEQLTRIFELIPSEMDPLKFPEAFFNVERLNLKVDETRDVQPRYRMQLWVEAVDNDVETGPHRGTGKEKVTFLVVSENELLSEVAKEEENLYLKLADRVKNLQDNMAKLDRLKEDLTVATLKPEQLSAMAIRTDELSQTTEKAEGIVGEVLTDYKRILQELITNRVQQAMIDRVDLNICKPLDVALSQDFPRTRGGLAELHKMVESKTGSLAARVDLCRTAADEARARLEVLLRNLLGVLDKMQQLADINTLIKKLREIEEEEVRQETVLKKIQKQLADQIILDLEKESKKP